MAENWWQAAPEAAPKPGGWWSSAPTVKPKGDGSYKAPYELERGYEGVTIPRGAYYRDSGGNIRRNENGLLRPDGRPQGNPIVTRKGEKPKTAPDIGRSFLTGAAQGTDPFTGATGDLRNNLNRLDAFGVVKGWRSGLESLGSGARQSAQRLQRSGQPGFSQFGDAALAAMDLVDAVNPLMLGGRAAPDSQDAAAARQTYTGPDYQPQTKAGEYARAVGRMAPNALMGGGGIGSRAAQVVAPAVGGQAFRDAAAGMGAGERGQAAAEIAGQVVGGIASGVRYNAPEPVARPQAQPAIDKFAKIAKVDPAIARASAQEYRGSGIAPTLADVTDDAGRGIIRDAASRMTPARQAVTDFNDARVVALPGRIGGQARRVMSQDPRNPIEIQADLSAQRTAAGDVAFGAVRGEPVPLSPDAAQTLQVPQVAAAIREAAMRERDPAARAALTQLGKWTRNAVGDPPPMTVGMADRVSRVLLSKAQVAARNGDNDLAATLGMFGRELRNPAREASPGYGAALDQWAADSRLKAAADTGGDFLNRNTDEFNAAVSQMTPEELSLARATARRALEAKAGESIGGAPNLARAVALTPEQQARNAALLGPQDAEALQNALRLEAMAVRNANDIAPRIGPQTANRLMDAQAAGAVEQGAGVALDLATHNAPGLIRRSWTWFKTRGISDQEAETLARAAIDPAQLDGVLTYLEQRYGPQAAQDFLTFRKEALIAPGPLGTMGAATAPSARPEDQGQAPQ